MIDVNVLLFNDFETLDVFGPVEIIGRLEEEYKIHLFSIEGGNILSRQQTTVATIPVSQINPEGILLIPGGLGTRQLVLDNDCIQLLKLLAEKAPYCLTVCTGTALLAKTGLLDERQATTNKKAFDWVQSLNPNVKWIYRARWIVDGKFYTSSGVSAGMDMVLGFISDRHGKDTSMEIADHIEYLWNDDPNHDPFCKKYL